MIWEGRPIALVLIFVISATGTIACAGHRGVKPVETTICDVVAHPEKYEKRLIAVEGWVYSDGRESTGIFDKACGDLGIELAERSPEIEEEGVDGLLQAIYSGHPGTTDKDIRAKFIGIFHWREGAVPSRTLTLGKVWDLEATKKE